MNRSPIELLDAVLDEVEGLRRTDPRSHLPAALVRELRDATAVPSVSAAKLKQFSSADGLVGRTITHVFESDVRKGDMLLLCADGGFVVFEAEPESEDEAHISTMYGSSDIAEYLRPGALAQLGLMNEEQRREAEKKEQIAAAERMLARAQSSLKSAEASRALAEAALARLKGEPPAQEPPASRSNPAPADAAQEGAPHG